jgi:hypothetical protein
MKLSLVTLDVKIFKLWAETWLRSFNSPHSVEVSCNSYGHGSQKNSSSLILYDYKGSRSLRRLLIISNCDNHRVGLSTINVSNTLSGCCRCCSLSNLCCACTDLLKYAIKFLAFCTNFKAQMLA